MEIGVSHQSLQCLNRASKNSAIFPDPDCHRSRIVKTSKPPIASFVRIASDWKSEKKVSLESRHSEIVRISYQKPEAIVLFCFRSRTNIIRSAFTVHGPLASAYLNRVDGRLAFELIEGRPFLP